MTDQIDTYGPALTALVQEAIRCAPESWEAGSLTIFCDGTRIDYKLKNPASTEKAQISNELARLSERYWAAFEQNGDAWFESTIEFFKVDGKWGFRSSHQYPEELTPEPPKPFWKFWH